MDREKNREVHVLLIDCADRKGIIHKVSGVLFAHNCNITNNREFVEISQGRFYMRTEFEGRLKDKDGLLKEIRSVLPDKAQVSIPARKKKKIVIFVTSEQHCLGELLLRNAYGEINAEILAVISNHVKLRNLVERFSIPFHHVENGTRKRGEHEGEIISLLDGYDPDLLVLAKYMRILSPDFVQKYHNRIINIHHSFLPAFVGANPYKQAHVRGVKIIGATAHFVTNELDEGPIIVQGVEHIDHTYDVDTMKQAGRDIEKITLVKALRLVCDDRVFLNGNKTIVFG
jgi:formyltetrahydrofolate deformylase